MAKKTYAKMIEELAAEIEKKDDTRNVLNSLHTLAYLRRRSAVSR